MGGFIDEFGVANRSEAEAGQLRSLDAKPLIVLTADRGNSKGWMADQNQTVTLSTNSVHRVVPGATHASFVDDPSHAAAVTRAIHDVVVSRTHRGTARPPLTPGSRADPLVTVAPARTAAGTARARPSCALRPARGGARLCASGSRRRCRCTCLRV